MVNGHDRAESSHIPALDGVRGIAIALVVLSHSYTLLPMNAATVLPIAIGRVGWAGVDMFFVLSGYLITGTLVATRGAPGYLRGFFARRALRIWPLYLAVLAVLTVLARAWPSVAPIDARQFLATWPWYWTHTVNVLFALRGRLGADAYATSHFWSLGIEEQFYLVWPFAVAWCPPRRLARLCIAVGVSSLAMRALLLADGLDPMATYTLPFTRLDALAVGGWIAAITGTAPEVRPRGLLARIAGAAPRRWLLGSVMVLTYLTVMRVGQFTATMQLAGFPVVALAAGALVSAARTGNASRLGRVLAWRPLTWIGRRSYGLYVLHLPIFFFVDIAAEAHHVPDGARLLAGYIATLVLAELSWTGWERRWLALKRYVPARRVPAPSSRGGRATEHPSDPARAPAMLRDTH